jgi:GNAT superfamily N-acetyltransferase
MAHFRPPYGVQRPSGRLSGHAVSRVPDKIVTTTTSGGVTLRGAGPEDLVAARAMHRRCSPTALALRYPGGAGEADRYLRHLFDPRHGRTVAACAPQGELAGLGHLLWDGHEAEAALLVADGWQRRGVGTALLRRLVRVAAYARCEAVYAITTPANTAAVATMATAARGTGLPLERQSSGETLVLTLRLVPDPHLTAGAVPGGLPTTTTAHI